METRMSASEAARRLFRLLDRVAAHRERFVVERRGLPACHMVPLDSRRVTVADLLEFLWSAPKPDAAYWDDLQRIIDGQPRLTHG